MATLLEEKDAIRDVIIRYCHYADSGQGDRWAEQFVEDAVWDGGTLGRFEGRAAIRSHFDAAANTDRHAIFNSLVTVDGDSAEALSYVMVYRVTKEGSSLRGGGYYRDRLVKRGERWLFKQRTFRPVLKPELLLA